MAAAVVSRLAARDDESMKIRSDGVAESGVATPLAVADESPWRCPPTSAAISAAVSVAIYRA
jgi:hypothetical protein